MRTERINYTPSTRTVIDFDVTDAKGRAVGFLRSSFEYDVVCTDGLGGYCLSYTETGHYFSLRGISTRNGEEFGASYIHVDGLCKATVEKEFAARVERARRAAVKKFTKAAAEALPTSTAQSGTSNNTVYLTASEDFKVNKLTGLVAYCVRNNRTGKLLAHHTHLDKAIADADRRALEVTQAKEALKTTH